MSEDELSLEEQFAKMREFTPPDDIRPLIVNLHAKRIQLDGLRDLGAMARDLWEETDGYDLAKLIRVYLETDERFVEMVQRTDL